jgi:hypothetical protein
MLDQTPMTLAELVREANVSNRLLAQINETLKGLTRFKIGTFTAANATSTTVNDTAVTASSFIDLMETNAAAGTLQAGTNRFYVSARSAGTSFTVATAGGGSAAGTEQFTYIIISPL